MALEYVWWKYLLIPCFASVIGYCTNVLALWMTFWPLNFWGIEIWRIKNEPWGLFGWQGIIPSKAEKMASITFELMTQKMFSVQEIFLKMDPVLFAQAMEDSVLLMMDAIINEVAVKYMPTAWSNLPKAVRDDIVVTADQECAAFLAKFMKDMQEHVDDVVDIKHMAVKACVENKALLVKIFQECGDKEFRFIRRCGFYFGFLFGIVQMCLWFVYPASWFLPFAGFIHGWLTNTIVFYLIFNPLHPKKFLCWTLQGIFLKRQSRVSEVFARVVCTEIMHSKAVWDSIFTGPLSKNFFAMLRAHTLVLTDDLLAEVKPLAIAAMGSTQFAQMKEDIAQKVIDAIPSIIDNSYEYTQAALNMEGTLRENLSNLPPEEFEGVLHPAFQDDEIELIATGGVLGAAVGVVQIYLFF